MPNTQKPLRQYTNKNLNEKYEGTLNILYYWWFLFFFSSFLILDTVCKQGGQVFFIYIKQKSWVLGEIVK